MDDFMEFGDSGWIPREAGWFVNKNTGERMDPDGNIYNESGELVKEATD